MEKELAEGQVGPVKYDLEIKEAKLVLKLEAGVGPLEHKNETALKLVDVKEAIKKAIPGQYDDLVLDGLFSLLEKA